MHLHGIAAVWSRGKQLRPCCRPNTLSSPRLAPPYTRPSPTLIGTMWSPTPTRAPTRSRLTTTAIFRAPFDTDTIPALLSWYSPTIEMTRGTTYYWRVRYIDVSGAPDSWSSTSSFDIGFPFIIDVLSTDGWDEIQAKHVQVATYGHSNAQAAELRFPVNHTFNLVQDPADDYLLQIQQPRQLHHQRQGEYHHHAMHPDGAAT